MDQLGAAEVMILNKIDPHVEFDVERAAGQRPTGQSRHRHRAPVGARRRSLETCYGWLRRSGREATLG